MNQILSIDNNTARKEIKRSRKNNKGPLDINVILKFFSIAILIFGIFMISTSAYSMYKNSKDEVVKVGPQIFVENTSEKYLTLKVQDKKLLSKITYKWNGEDEETIELNGEQNIEQKIEMPKGENTLYIYASDTEGKESRYEQVYTREEKIAINIEISGTNIKVTAEGKDEISYITYRWDEEDEEKIDVNDIRTEQTITIPKGQHTLTVVAVDINNNMETEEKEVIGTTKPKIKITTDGENFIVKASDEQGLMKLVYLLNDEKYTEEIEGETEFEHKIPLEDGENKLTAVVYNQNKAYEKVKVKATK